MTDKRLYQRLKRQRSRDIGKLRVLLGDCLIQAG